jgi:transposase-like protein
MRSLLAYVPKSHQTVVSAAVRQVFVQPDRKNAGQAWRHVADQLRPRFRKIAALLDDAEHDVLAYMDYPEAHRSKLYSTNPIARLNKEVKRRTNVVGIFPNEASVTTSTMLPLWTSNGRWCLSAHSSARVTERVSTALR